MNPVVYGISVIVGAFVGFRVARIRAFSPMSGLVAGGVLGLLSPLLLLIKRRGTDPTGGPGAQGRDIPKDIVAAEIIGLLLVAAMSPTGQRDAPQPQAAAVTPSAPVASSEAAAERAPSPRQVALSELHRVAEGIKDAPADYANKDAVILQLAVIGVAATSTLKWGANDDPEIKEAAGKLRGNLSRFQVREFPKLRRAWARFADQTMWENDIRVAASGTGVRTLTFVGGAFAANRNVKTTWESLSEVLKELRFRQIRFKWHQGQDDYQYYDLSSAADADLVGK